MADVGDPSSAWESWLRSWQRSLRARKLSPKTVSLYLSAGRELVAHLERTGGPDEPRGLRREHVEGLILELQERGRTPSGVSLVYRSLQQLMKYLGQEGELERSPMEHMTAPIIPELTTPVLFDDDLRALLVTCAGRDFVCPSGHRAAAAVHRHRRTTGRGRRTHRGTPSSWTPTPCGCSARDADSGR